MNRRDLRNRYPVFNCYSNSNSPKTKPVSNGLQWKAAKETAVIVAILAAFAYFVFN